MITFLIYFCGVVDMIKIVTALFTLACGVCFIILMAAYILDNDMNAKSGATLLGIILAFIAPIALFTPDSKTIAAMIVIPRATHHTAANDITPESLKALEALASQWIDEKAGNK